MVDWIAGDIFINQSKIGAIRSPILLVHGQYDDIVTVDHSQVRWSAPAVRRPRARMNPRGPRACGRRVAVPRTW